MEGALVEISVASGNELKLMQRWEEATSKEPEIEITERCSQNRKN